MKVLLFVCESVYLCECVCLLSVSVYMDVYLHIEFCSPSII